MERNLSDDDYVGSVRKMTHEIYGKWKRCIKQILNDKSDDRSKYQKYLTCIENLSSQIRSRQIVPLGINLIHILDECKIAPTWNIYHNLWFAFNVEDKYTPSNTNMEFISEAKQTNEDMEITESDEDEEDIVDDEEYVDLQIPPSHLSQFQQFLNQSPTSNAIASTSAGSNDNDYALPNILDTKFKELQEKYIRTDHINYLMQNKRTEEAILMLNTYGTVKKKLQNNITDQYKLNCIKDYIIDKELRNDYLNYYPFAMSHWYPTSFPISTHYQIQRRIDPKSNTGIVISYDWYKKQDDINVNKDKDITFYVPQVIMHQTRYKSAILQYCTEQLFNSDNEKYGHLQLEILPSTKDVGRKKLDANSMKPYYDLFVIRGCQSLDEKLEIWHEIIDLFENKLQLLTTVSVDDNPNISIRNFYPYSQEFIFGHQLTKAIKKICSHYKCKIDANSISSFQFDRIPTFFIWQNVRIENFDETGNNLKYAAEALNDQLIQSDNTDPSFNRHSNDRAPILYIDVSAKYYNALYKMYHSKHAQIEKDLRYIRDRSRFKLMDTNIFEKDKYDGSKGGIVTITAPTRSLRKRIYQQIFYTHPPTNDAIINIHDKIEDLHEHEWRDIDYMLYDLISSMEDNTCLTLSNALFFSRLKEKTNLRQNVKNYKQWMMGLFKNNENDDILPVSSMDEIVKLCQLLFTGLSFGKEPFNHAVIAQIFHNIVTNKDVLKIIHDTNDQSSICQLLYCSILSLCNNATHTKSISITDFHRIRAAFLHLYCGKSKNDEHGINRNFSTFMQEILDSESYIMILLEYLYISCQSNNPNLGNHIIRFLDELGTLMANETTLNRETYEEFCTSAFDLLLMDIQAPQQQIANDFISMYQNMEEMIKPSHNIYSEMDVETLKIILAELTPLEIENINTPYGNIENLYRDLCIGCSMVGNIDCIKILLNRVEFLSKSYESNNELGDFYTFGIDDEFIQKMCGNIWTYYSNTCGYDLEITCHSMMQIFECLLSGENKLWANIISEETIAEYAVIMAENKLMSEMYELKELMSSDNDKFKELSRVLTNVDYSMYLDDSSLVHDQ